VLLEAICRCDLQSTSESFSQHSLNIAEGYTYGDSPTFTKHLGIAYGSVVETAQLLRLAREARLADEVVLNNLLDRANETERILLGMLKNRRRFKT
jgi:four helix bundle protein